MKLPDLKRYKYRDNIDTCILNDEFNFVETEEYSSYFEQEEDIDSSPLFEDNDEENVTSFL